MERGQLEVVQTSPMQMNDILGIGRLAIIDGELAVFGIDRTKPIADPQPTAPPTDAPQPAAQPTDSSQPATQPTDDSLPATPSTYEPWMSSWQPISDLLADYSKEQAIADGIVVIAYDGTHNQYQADLFYRDVASGGGAAFMRVMQQTREGDVIITDYQYDGNVFTVTHDSTRDRFSAIEDKIISTRTYIYLVQSNRPQSDSGPGTASDAPDVYYLSK